METIKTIVAMALSPYLIGLAFLALGIWLLRLEKPRRAKFALVASLLVLILGALPIWTYGAFRKREYEYAPFDTFQFLAASQADDPSQTPPLIVVLGAGFNNDAFLPANSRVSGSYLARLIEGVRVHRQLPGSRLWVSIAGKAPDESKQSFLEEIIQTIRVDESDVTPWFTAESTRDEAEAIAEQMAGTPQREIILVTSAFHMRRAVQAFRDAGLSTIPAPTDYSTTRAASPNDKPWQRWIPSEGGIASNRQFLYETVAGIVTKTKRLATSH